MSGTPIEGFTVMPGPVQLFAFSAATWNPHRVHYDADYCRDVEDYPGVVVPGPLQGSWLLELADAWAREAGLRVESIEYRNVRPAFSGAELAVGGRVVQGPPDASLELWVASPDGERHSVATARARPPG
jgi:3-methylfumaryl-CoA hydratase